MMNSQKLGDVNATTNYKPSTAALDVIIHQDDNHQLRLSGDIPVSLDWAHGFAATIGNNQKMRAHSAGIRLAPFGGVAPKILRNAAGMFQADLELTGPPLHPAVNGTLAITGGGGDVVPIGVTVSDFELRLLASPTSIEIAELSAKAGDGTLSGSGSIALHDNYSPDAIDVILQRYISGPRSLPSSTTQKLAGRFMQAAPRTSRASREKSMSSIRQFIPTWIF
jgi:hypothetical protein